VGAPIFLPLLAPLYSGFLETRVSKLLLIIQDFQNGQQENLVRNETDKMEGVVGLDYLGKWAFFLLTQYPGKAIIKFTSDSKAQTVKRRIKGDMNDRNPKSNP
jgi:hypothetical protein